MAFSSIEIRFNRRVEINENVFFNWRDLDVNGGLTTYITNEVWAATRTRPGLVQYSIEQNNGEIDVINYRTAFNYDYNGSNLFTVTLVDSNTIRIEAKKTNIEFFSYQSNGGATAVIDNQAQVPTFNIVSVAQLEANANPCTNVKVRVTASSPITNLLAPVEILGVNNSVVEFDYVRGTNFQVVIENATEQRTQSVTTTGFLNTPIINRVNTPQGTTATIIGYASRNDMQYSLDGVTYQLSNVFFGLATGLYTAYAKDSYGCIKSASFTVDSFTPDVTVDDPFAYVSNTNSIRFKKDEVWDNNNIFKNDSNTLSFEERALLNVPFIHKFTDQDVVPIQYKTNYETQVVTLINCTNGTEDILTPIRETNNLNKVDVRDAVGYDFNDGRFGFYFQTGNIYEDDFPVNTIKGEYELYGSLPAWAKIGNYFSVDFGAYVKIDDIVFVESLNANVIVTDVVFVGTAFVLKANYNVFNWDAYEFDIDMTTYLNKEFQIKIEMTDTDFDPVTFISEKVQVYSDLSDRLTIKASNTENNDVVYATGIVHIARVDYDLDGLADESELDVHKTDDNVYQLNGYSYDKKQLTLTRMSTMIARQLRQMLTLDVIYINGVRVTIESIETPARIGISNNYKMDVTYYEVTDKPTSGDVDTDVELDIIDVPALIIGNNDFIKQ